MKKRLSVVVLLCMCTNLLIAQSDTVRHHRIVKNGVLYGSWGYNTEWYTRSNIHIVQPSLQNDFTFENIQAHDHIGWDHLFHVQFTIPQYNYRLGYFFDKKQLWAFELNFDHTKYVVTQGQMVTLKGTMNGKPIDNPSLLITPYVLIWQLNNGANFFLFNIVRKLPVYSSPKTKDFIFYSLVKAGVGPVIPHVDNTIFGNANNRHFQLGGWNTGVEGVLRFIFFKYAYLEYCCKLDYARYSYLGIYAGEANQAFGCFEMIANAGICVPLSKGNTDYAPTQTANNSK